MARSMVRSMVRLASRGSRRDADTGLVPAHAEALVALDDPQRDVGGAVDLVGARRAVVGEERRGVAGDVARAAGCAAGEAAGGGDPLVGEALGEALRAAVERGRDVELARARALDRADADALAGGERVRHRVLGAAALRQLDGK